MLDHIKQVLEVSTDSKKAVDQLVSSFDTFVTNHALFVEARTSSDAKMLQLVESLVVLIRQGHEQAQGDRELRKEQTIVFKAALGVIGESTKADGINNDNKTKESLTLWKYMFGTIIAAILTLAGVVGFRDNNNHKSSIQGDK